jgi:hypothetical protein
MTIEKKVLNLLVLIRPISYLLFSVLQNNTYLKTEAWAWKSVSVFAENSLQSKHLSFLIESILIHLHFISLLSTISSSKSLPIFWMNQNGFVCLYFTLLIGSLCTFRQFRKCFNFSVEKHWKMGLELWDNYRSLKYEFFTLW